MPDSNNDESRNMRPAGGGRMSLRDGGPRPDDGKPKQNRSKTMKTGIAIAIAYWTAIAVGGVWGWLAFVAAAVVLAGLADRKAVR